jgi:hypothetical protein
MTITGLLYDKTKKAKEKAETLSKWLLNGSMPVHELIAFAEKAKDTEKATCIEAIEYATKQNPGIAEERVFAFVTKMLAENAPRVKWESARVTGNIAHLFPARLNKATGNLLANSEHNGTVVRWASAFALGEILKLKTIHNKTLLPAIEAICSREQDNGVKKKYLDAIKKIKK